jgi:hypothetical protein
LPCNRPLRACFCGLRSSHARELGRCDEPPTIGARAQVVMSWQFSSVLASRCAAANGGMLAAQSALSLCRIVNKPSGGFLRYLIFNEIRASAPAALENFSPVPSLSCSQQRSDLHRAFPKGGRPSANQTSRSEGASSSVAPARWSVRPSENAIWFDSFMTAYDRL